jgi:hypothetical protein
MGNLALLRCPIAAVVREVGTFDGEASPMAVLEIGGAEIRIPVTPEEARALASRMYQTIGLRLAVEGPPASDAPPL